MKVKHECNSLPVMSSTYLPGCEIPIVDDSGWYDANIIPMTYLAIILTSVITLPWLPMFPFCKKKNESGSNKFLVT